MTIGISSRVQDHHISVPLFVVVGGGTAGAGYARQLLRALRAGRLDTGRILVVDRRPACEAAALPPPVEVAVGEWGGWLAEHLGRLDPRAHLVPYHWAPHLLFDWLLGEVARAGGRPERLAPPPPRDLPFENLTRAGDRALSYASWPCPPACIEPALCPHTRGLRDWSLAGDLRSPRAGEADDALVLPSLHLVWGVGTIPVRAIHEARDRLVAAIGSGRTMLVSTASHCHGLAARLRV